MVRLMEQVKACIDAGGDEDLEFILADKARVGSDILHRVNNAKPRGGVMMYADVCRWFTKTSGLGLAEQTAKLMNPKAAAKP